MKISLEHLRNLILQEVTAINAEELALKTSWAGDELEIYLFTVPDVRVVGVAGAQKTDKACIPETYQIGSIAIAEEIQGTGLGFLLYKIILQEINGRGYGRVLEKIRGRR
mgnify:CR=1 FL=1